jgi:protein AroM
VAVKIGFVTIGQSPRVDVVPEIARILGPKVGILEKGALDGLSGEEIRKLQPEEGDFRLITRLRDGSTAVVGKKKIVPLLKKKIVELAGLDVRLIAVLCTDEFPSIRQRRGGPRIVLQPFRLLIREVRAMGVKGNLGVFVPLREQKEETKRKWKKAGLPVAVETLNPYHEVEASEEAIGRMRHERVDLIVLDCIGYSKETTDKLQSFLGKPVLLPRAVLAKAIIQHELFMK